MAMLNNQRVSQNDFNGWNLTHQYPSMPMGVHTWHVQLPLLHWAKWSRGQDHGGNGGISFAQNGDMMWMMYVNIYIYITTIIDIYIYITIIVIYMVPPGVRQPPSQCYPPQPPPAITPMGVASRLPPSVKISYAILACWPRATYALHNRMTPCSVHYCL